MKEIFEFKDKTTQEIESFIEGLEEISVLDFTKAPSILKNSFESNRDMLDVEKHYHEGQNEFFKYAGIDKGKAFEAFKKFVFTHTVPYIYDLDSEYETDMVGKAIENFCIMQLIKEFSIYTVKNVKSFIGSEGYGFSCSLYENKKRVAFITDKAEGGEWDFLWYDNEAEKRFLNIDREMIIAQLIELYEQNKKFKRICKKKTVIILHSDNIDNPYGDKYQIINIPYSEINIQILIDEYKDDLKEIVNERYYSYVGGYNE